MKHILCQKQIKELGHCFYNFCEICVIFFFSSSGVTDKSVKYTELALKCPFSSSVIFNCPTVLEFSQ